MRAVSCLLADAEWCRLEAEREAEGKKHRHTSSSLQAGGKSVPYKGLFHRLYTKAT